MSNLVSTAVQKRVVGSALRKAVLLYMADKAADDGTGIWASKVTMACDLEVSDRAIRLAVSAMLDAGLIAEVGQRNRRNGYTVEYAIILDAIERLPRTREYPASSAPAPCGKPVDNSPKAERGSGFAAPKAERGSGLRRNVVPGNHPNIDTTTAGARARAVDNPEAEAQCLEAAGPGLCPESRRSILSTTDVIDGWLADGFDLHQDVLPVIRQRTDRLRGSPIRTWAYFTQPIRAAHQARVSQAARSQNAENSMAPAASAESDRPPAAQADAEARLRFFADWINSDRHLPPSAVTNTTLRALLARGLVTTDRLRQRGLPHIF